MLAMSEQRDEGDWCI